VLSGYVVGNSGAVNKAEVSALIPGCSIAWKAWTGTDGDFSLELPVLSNFSPLESTFTISKDDATTTRTELLGGLPLVNRKQVPDFYLLQTAGTGTLSPKFIDSESGKSLSPNVKLFNESGEKLTKFKSIPTGTYSLKVDRSGYIDFATRVTIK
jgi:hypothetical protein